MFDPALTPEEWSWPHAVSIGGDSPKMGVVASAAIDETGTMRISWHPQITSSFPCDPDQRHRLAALALHGQWFGFTWADVDSLEALADDYGPGHMKEWVRDLACRIESLLPPRS